MLQHSCQRVLKPAARLVARQQLLRTTHSLLTAPPARSYCRQHPACSAKPTLSRWLPAAAASATLRSKQQLRAAATDTMATDAAVNSVLDSLYSKAAGQEEASIAAAPSASAPAAQEQQAAPAAAPAANMDTMLDDLYGTAGEEAAAPAPELEPAAAAAAPAAAPGTSAPCFSPNPQVKRSASPPEPAAAVEAPRVNPLAKKLKQAQARAATPSEAPTTTIIKPPTLPEDLSVFQNAALLVDKPAGWTSFNVCNELKTSLERVGIDKVGHAGTLDPLATGLLVVCTGKGTKAIESFMSMTKQYSGTMKLGEATSSYDSETEVLETKPWQHLSDEELKKAAAALTGNIMQLPPMYSAIKMGGQKLYDLAREGKTVEVEARPVSVPQYDVWREEEGSQTVHFRVTCSKGTYIRSLIHDLGKALDCGAHMTSLRREGNGDQHVKDAWQAEELIKALKDRPEVVNGRAPKHHGRGRGRSHRGGRGRKWTGEGDKIRHKV